MIRSALAVLMFTTMYASAGPVIARRAHPALATRILVPTGLLISAAGCSVLAMAALTLVGQFPEVAEIGPWSPVKLRADTPFPPFAAATGGLLLAGAAVSTAVLVSRRSIALVDVHRTCGRLGAPGSVVVIESDRPDAFTTPEATGRIVVTRGMLAALTPAEQRAMLAHEASHLRHRHTWWLLAADLAAAVNPMLRPTSRALRHTVERWADEDAADATADRRIVAYALAHAALAAYVHRTTRTPAPRPSPVSALGGDVPARVAALLGPRRRPVRSSVAAAALSFMLVASTAHATLSLQRRGEDLFERAMSRSVGAVHTGTPGRPR